MSEGYMRAIEEAQKVYNQTVLLDPVKASEQLLKSYTEASRCFNQNDIEIESDLRKLAVANRIIGSLKGLITDVELMNNRKECESAVTSAQKIINAQ
jgi:hypothetical protein